VALVEQGKRKYLNRAIDQATSLILPINKANYHVSPSVPPYNKGYSGVTYLQNT
jgi:hypothetical protein